MEQPRGPRRSNYKSQGILYSGALAIYTNLQVRYRIGRHAWEIDVLDSLLRNWILVEEGVEARNVNGILGLLWREHFPGLVYKLEEDVEGELPSFDQYALFPADDHALSTFCTEAQPSKHRCTIDQPPTSETSNVGSTRESATSHFHLLPSFYISCTAIESKNIPADEPYRNLADQVISELWVSLSRSTALISLLSLDILEIK
jgi:hypothetical protein